MKKQLLSLALLSAAWFAGGTAWAQSTPSQDGDGYYLLGSVEDVEWFSQQVADGHCTIKGKLTDDIDFNNIENAHKPIGIYGKKFIGKFDGQNHRIKNMVLNDPPLSNASNDGTGFFGCVRVGGDGFIMGSDTEKETNSLVEIKNLIIDSSCSVTSSRQCTAGLVGRISEVTSGNTVLIENCVNEATINTTAQATAGIVGQINNANGGNVDIKKCINKGTVTTTGLAAAGIISQVNNCTVTLTIESCMNFADVTSTDNKNCGGIHGANTKSQAIIKIINCGNTGNVTGTSESAAITGWIGNKAGQEISNCWNSGTVTGHSGASMYMYRDQNSSVAETTNLYDASGVGTQGTAITNDDITSGKLCYLLNTGQDSIVWYQLIGTDAYPMPAEKSGAQVYNVDLIHCSTGTTDSNVTYSNSNTAVRDHSYDNSTGLCSCSYPKADWLSLTEGYYELGSVEEIEWFGAMVREAKNGLMKGKLVDDIDFTDKTHTPIGPTSGAKFFGEFDGQGHTISNLEMDESDNAGFFLWVRGGSTIKNLIMDSSCSFHATNRAAAFVCVIQAATGGAINIENCINKAAVSSENLVSSAFVAACNWENSDQPALNLTNCCNTGNITQNGTDCAVAFFGWNKGTCTIKGCYNTGTIYPLDSDKRNLVRSEAHKSASILNSYDSSATEGKTQGVKTDWTTGTPISSGELCYYLNGDQSTIGWKQTIGTDAEPKLFGSSQQVYVQGNVATCTGAPVGDVTYSNTDGKVELGHSINAEIGMCEYCYTQFQEPTKDGDYYLLRNAGNVEWFSSAVKNGGGAAFYAKLMNDIDFLNRENLHNPIGPTTGSKFKGVFDGQGYRIKNMIINRPADGNIGFFGFLQGNSPTTVQNLIIDSSCTITGNNRIGGITGSFQNSGGTITIENVVNEATINANQDAGGIFGGREGGNPTIIIRNCVNAGTITADNSAPYAGALCCFFEGNANSKIENFLNIGTINGHLGGNIGRHNMSDVTNLIDLSDTTNKTQGSDSGLKNDDIANGKLAWYINSKDNQAADAFFQRLGTGGEAYPSPFGAAGVLYLGETGYTTMYDTQNSWSLSADAQAYIGKVSGSYLSLVGIDDVPAGTAVVIKGTPNTYSNKEFVATATADVTGNALKGSDGSDTDKGDGSTIFALSNKANGVGFYPVGNGVTIPAGKAYLEYTGSNPVKGFTFVFDEDDATGISLMEDGRSQMEDGAIYNIAGQRLDNSQFTIHNSQLKRGIYIVNCKKVLK